MFDAQDEIIQGMIRILPVPSGYSKLKGIFLPCKAIAHCTQQKGVQAVD
jgi:hypothetical protein